MFKIKRIKDFFFAGTVLGLIAGVVNSGVVYILSLFLTFRTPWGDSAVLFFNPPELFWLPAKIFGFLMSLSTPVVIGIFLCLLVKLTGKDYVYVKSIVLSESITLFTFAVVYPSLGFKYLKHSILTNYIALLFLIPFGIFLGYLIKTYTDFDKH
jgi:hypothetical protein